MRNECKTESNGTKSRRWRHGDGLCEALMGLLGANPNCGFCPIVPGDGTNGKLPSLFGYLLIGGLIFAWPHAHSVAAESTTIRDASLGAFLDEFKTCAITWRYDARNQELAFPEPMNSVVRTRARLHDGYATVRLKIIFHGLHVSELTIPATTSAWPQYQMRIKANSSQVVEALRLAWGVEFDEIGPDGLDGRVLVNYRMKSDSGQIRVTSLSPSSLETFVECNPPKTKIKE